MQTLNGKVALVTGSARGIGAAIAARLAREGAAVMVNYSRAAEPFEAGAARTGLPEFVIEAITVTASSARQGKYEVSDDVVLDVLGRRATNLADWIARHRDAFAPEGRA